MVWLVRDSGLLKERYPRLMWVHNSDHVLAYEHAGMLFVFNFDPTRSYEGYPIPVSVADDYAVIMSTDDAAYGGQNRVDRAPHSAMTPGLSGNNVRLYLPSRTALVLKPVHGVPAEKPAKEKNAKADATAEKKPAKKTARKTTAKASSASKAEK